MRVQRVASLGADEQSWTVLGDDWLPVQPVEFLAHLSDQRRSPNTVKAYAHDLKDYFEYLERRSLSWDRLRYDELAAFKPWLRLPTAARRGEISVLSATVSACTESTINRKLAAITSFYEFHRRHGVDMALTIRDASRPVVSTSTSFRPFLAHVAAAADVTRSWLYTQPEIRAAIDRLRDLNGRSIAAPVPAESEALSAPWFADSGPHTDAIRNSAVKSPSCAISSPPLTEKLRAARRRTYEPAVVDLPERRRS